MMIICIHIILYLQLRISLPYHIIIYIYIISARYLLRQVRYEVASYDIMFLDTTNINRFWNHVSTTYDFDNCIITCTTIVYKFFLVYMYFFLHILHFNRIFPYHLVMTDSLPWKDPPFLRTVNHLFLWDIYTMAM